MKNFNSMSLRVKDNTLEVLDQTQLPNHEIWRVIESPSDMIKAIRELQVRGAPLIGVAAALCLGLWAEEHDSFSEFDNWAEQLRASRPTAVNLMAAIDRLKGISIAKPDFSAMTFDWRSHVLSEAEAIFEEDVELCAKIGNVGAKLIQNGDRILTHCNTGGLATVGIGTALGVIETAHRQGQQIQVFVDETRPLLQGGRLTTYELEKLQIPFTLICDNMAASLMGQKRIDKVIVGSDRIAANGDFANKVGTYSLAVLCHYHKIPFYVAAPYTTLDSDCSSGQDIPIEERSPQEVRGVSGSFGAIQWAQESAKVYNPAFDVTPAELVTGWILDRGLFSLEQVAAGAFRSPA